MPLSPALAASAASAAVAASAGVGLGDGRFRFFAGNGGVEGIVEGAATEGAADSAGVALASLPTIELLAAPGTSCAASATNAAEIVGGISDGVVGVAGVVVVVVVGAGVETVCASAGIPLAVTLAFSSKTIGITGSTESAIGLDGVRSVVVPARS